MLKPHLDKLEDAAMDIVKNLDTALQESKNQTLARVVNRLMTEHGFNIEYARNQAAKAIAELDSRDIDGYIDLDASTSKCLYVRVNGEIRIMSLADIVRGFEYL